jgi:hypothetical protein
MVTIEEYRKMLNDRTSSDEQIKTRLDYLEGFCRHVIKAELQAYADTKKLNHESRDQPLCRA